MRQRVSIARALAVAPEVILMDEPFASLDAQLRLILQDELVDLWESERRTVVFITHDIDEAIFLANRVAVMTARPGHIKCDLPIDLPHPRHYTLKTSPEFSAYKARLTEEIRAETIRAVEMGA